MVELVDTLVSGTSAFSGMEVRVFFRAGKTVKSCVTFLIPLCLLSCQSSYNRVAATYGGGSVPAVGGGEA